MPKFTVDTHLFRELGELLVGRDSTALVELIKNAYDADATFVTVEGSSLSNPDHGLIVITDDGIGMTSERFEQGFLRIASRLKEVGDKRSPNFDRRFTGAKGVGRLAAHKLSKFMSIESVPDRRIYGLSQLLDAKIDWDAIESKETLDDLAGSDAIVLNLGPVPTGVSSGTRIELRRLRRRWTPAERARFFWEVQTFRPPEVLINIPRLEFKKPLLFEKPRVNDAGGKDPGFKVSLTGEFEAGDEYWQALTDVATWLVEIRARKELDEIEYLISPTSRCLKDFPEAEPQYYSIKNPTETNGPYFDARILVREGPIAGHGRDARGWLGRMSGVRIYMEGFRVLPYGEPSDDWLDLNADYKRRARALRYLDDTPSITTESVKDEGLSILGNEGYFGAIFLTQESSGSLRMLVNREGFVPDAYFDSLKKLIRIGIDLSVRTRASITAQRRQERRVLRKGEMHPPSAKGPGLRESLSDSIQKAADLGKIARRQAASGKFDEAEKLMDEALSTLKESAQLSEHLLVEPSTTRMLAAIGTQMAAFVHEINGLLGMARSLEEAVQRIRKRKELGREARRDLANISARIGDLRRAVERQASYLTDITSPDARRRRSRLDLSERFRSAIRLVAPSIERQGIRIANEIPEGFKTPPMFPAELTLVFSNLLTNAVKAAGKNGFIVAKAKESKDRILMRVENSGKAVDLKNAERWFKPFESTTLSPDPYLGQGMGMGLPITRNILEEYGAIIQFVPPSTRYSTALEISFPKG